MKNGTCPKCGSTEVYHQVGHQASQELIVLVGGILSRGIAPDKYACTNCGYLEYYLPLADDIKTIQENWKKVSVA
jgi:predicted nucleic-acid-binding Zn-ribbon protein